MDNKHSRVPSHIEPAYLDAKQVLGLGALMDLRRVRLGKGWMVMSILAAQRRSFDAQDNDHVGLPYVGIRERC